MESQRKGLLLRLVFKCSKITGVVFKFVYKCLVSVSMCVRLLLNMFFVCIYRLSALIAVNLFKKKQSLIKTVNIACVDFRFVKKKLLHVFTCLGFFGIFLRSIRYPDNQSGKMCCVFNQSEARQKPTLRMFTLPSSRSMFSRASCHLHSFLHVYVLRVAYLSFKIPYWSVALFPFFGDRPDVVLAINWASI